MPAIVKYVTMASMKNPLDPEPLLSNYDTTKANFSWDSVLPEFSFYKNGLVNYAYEVTDYQVKKGNGEKHAIITQKPDGTVMHITFKTLAEVSTVLAGNLQTNGLKAGDRFGLYASKSIEYVIVLMAAIKCGAIVVPLFDAFGRDAIADRLGDCEATWLYTSKKLVKNVDLASIPSVRSLMLDEPADLSATVSTFLFADMVQGTPDPSSIVFGNLETPFIIHYTSGSTAKPKGILLAQRAMIGHLVTAKFVLDLHPDDRYWNTGDPGWVTGMVYNYFAPLLLGVAAHMYEGPFNPQEWLKFMSRMDISVWYSTPTAFRLLRYYGVPLNKENTPSLRHIVSAGEPLNPSLIDWTLEGVGVPIHDSWYMTENGHQLINNYRSVSIRKGSMGKSLPGIHAAIIDENGTELPAGYIGRLAVKTPWPGLMQTVWNNPKKFDTYFQNGWYISGDTAMQDEDGYFWFQGREDDMIKSAAERISPFEVESALVAHPQVAEAGVIGKPHDLYGTIIKAFIIVKPGVAPDDKLRSDLTRHVRETLAAHEVPREIDFVEKLPKTKSGKIMRRVLRARELNLDIGDLSTLDAEMNPEDSK
jgi:acetyl-CoA synthetase